MVTEDGLEYEADQRHAEILMRDMGMDESCKGVVTPGVSAGEWRGGRGGMRRLPRSCGEARAESDMKRIHVAIDCLRQ